LLCIDTIEKQYKKYDAKEEDFIQHV
jgi:hypothetical protein